MSYKPGPKIPPPRTGPTEFEILKASHKFLRQDGPPTETTSSTSTSWNEQLAEKYYASLYREFALCDLKHYKSGNFALRWRTEDEVLSGAGETTCANTRCEHHRPAPSSSYLTSSRNDSENLPKVPLTTLELPFAYQEHGEHKSALVKVVLCDRCVRKLMWKRNKEKEEAALAMEKERCDGRELDKAQDSRKRHRHQSDEDGGERHNRKPKERPSHRRRSRSPTRPRAPPSIPTEGHCY